MTADARVAFIAAHTTVRVPPLLPELRLHLADEVIPLWQHLEQAAGGPVDVPFWASAWAGGQAVARYLFDHPELVTGRRVLDLASGGGVAAIAAARCGAEHVIANEIDPYAAAAIVLNADRNAVRLQLEPADLLDQDPNLLNVDVILAGDVFYSREMATRAQAYLVAAASAGRRVLVGDPGRAYLPRNLLERLASYPVPVTHELESCPIRQTEVWQLRSTVGVGVRA
jgi:predicted nicotinamide N-methyase